MSKHSLLSTFISLAFAVGSYAAIGPVTDLVISDAVVAPDGFSRAAVVVNGNMPGPIIAGKKGDRFKINVIDKMDNHTMNKTTSIHWHGLFQHHTNWADGAGFVNQCPIASGNSFLYDFSVPDQAGTYWYHSHIVNQYCDGLRGPLVIYDPHDPLAHMYDVDDDSTVITLADWYHLAANVGPIPMQLDSVLINGLGRSPTSGTGDLAVVNVTQGKRYRFRLVSLSCDPNFVFSIDNHNLTIIETDGVSTQPHCVDSLQIFASQRYSFVLEANQPIDNYWIRANPSEGTLGFAGGINSAILRYEGAPPTEPNSTVVQPNVNLLRETDLTPLVRMPVPGRPGRGNVDHAINLEFGFNPLIEGGRFFLNNATFHPPKVPVLLQILSGAHTAQEIMPAGSIYALPRNASIEISFPANRSVPGGPHPFHLHGHTFAVVRSSNSTEYNYENPIFRDTVSTGFQDNDDNVTIRFETNNPGPWFLHCHIESHLNAGFAVVMAEDIPDVAVANPVPQDWSNLCPIYDALPESEL